MQFFFNHGQFFIDQNLKIAKCDSHGFAFLTGFKEASTQWKNFAVEELGFIIVAIIDNTFVSIFNRQHINKKQVTYLLEQFKKSKRTHFFLIEHNTFVTNTLDLLCQPVPSCNQYYKIHDVDGLSNAVKTLTHLFNNKNEQSHDGKSVSFMDEEIVELDDYIKNGLEIYKIHKGYFNNQALKMIQSNLDLNERTLIFDENFKFLHFGKRIALHMGDGNLSDKYIKNDVRNLEFKEYVRERTKILANAFYADTPFFQHVDTLLDHSFTQLNLTYKIGIFPWRSPIGRIIQTVSNNRYELND